MDHVGNDLVNPWVVTGAEGYLGNHICNRLESSGVPFTAVSRHGRNYCDLLDITQVKQNFPRGRPVLHLAATVPSGSDYGNATLADENLGMVSNILSIQPPRIVFASSMTVYSKFDKMPVREGEANHPDTEYGRSKLEAERLLAKSGIPSVALRLPGLFGPPRTSGLIASAIRELLENGEFHVRPNPPLWAAMHVDDAAEMCVRATRMNHDRYIALNIGYMEPMSVADVIGRITTALGTTSKAVSVEAPIFEMDLTTSKQWLGSPPRTFDQALRSFVHYVQGEIYAE